MGILRSCFGYVPFEDNVHRLIDSELRALDKVREIGFEKWKRWAVRRMRQASDGSGSRKFREEALKQVKALRIVWQSRRPRNCNRGFQRGVPCAK